MVDADLEGPLLTISVVPRLLHCRHMGCPILRRSAAGNSVLIGAAALIFLPSSQHLASGSAQELHGRTCRSHEEALLHVLVLHSI
jgi:hypothetical protein